MLFEADKIYQGTSLINPGTGPGVDTPLVQLILLMGLKNVRNLKLKFLLQPQN